MAHGDLQTSSRGWRAIVLVVAIGVATTLAACGGDDDGASSGAAGTEDTGGSSATTSSPAASGPIELDDQGGGAGAQLCATYTADQIGDYLGTAVEEGEVVYPLDSGCQWDAQDGSGYIGIQMTPPDFFSPPTNDPDYTEVEGLGDEAYTAPGLFGDATAAVVVEGRFHILVSVEGADDGFAVALEVLRDLFARQG